MSHAEQTPSGAENLRSEDRLDHAVRVAETALIEFEIAVETFRIEVENFSRLHQRRLGPLHHRLEELDALIAEAVAARTGHPDDIRRAWELREQLASMPPVSALFQERQQVRQEDRQEERPRDWQGGEPEAGPAPQPAQPEEPPAKVRPGEEARRLYRDLVRKAHPDLARDDAERDRRGTFLIRVNEAYARGDAAALRELAEAWERDVAGGAPPQNRGEELAARLEWLAHRKELLADAAAALQESAIGAMMRLAPDDPDGLLEEIAADLQRQVTAREAELAALLTDGGR